MRASHSLSLTEGPMLPAIIRFSIPLMLSNVLQVLFNMSDIAVVGRFAGARALGAVGSTTILVTLFTGFLIGMGSGVNVVTARYLGAGRHRDVSMTVHTSAILLLITGAGGSDSGPPMRPFRSAAPGSPSPGSGRHSHAPPAGLPPAADDPGPSPRKTDHGR